MGGEDTIGRTFGDFTVKARLGAGGAGEVFLAEQLTLGRQAVIKVLAQRTELSKSAAERFLREARLASRLDHPFAAHVYAFGVEQDGTLWIAMELVRGTPLDKLLAAQGPIPLARFVPLLDRLSEVLNAAHEQGIVHRDIKPANVMVLQRAGRLTPKLLDLGIARAVATESPPGPLVTDSDFPETELPELTTEPQTLTGSMAGRLTKSESMHLTQLGSVVGTPHYMPPEQWSNASDANAQSDVYSLAVLTYQALTGRLPFEGKSLMALARAHARHPLPPLGEGLPEGLWAVLNKGTAKKTSERFTTPLEFAAAVRGASGLGVEPATLPQLDDGLRENVLSEAPQPLAEAVALLDRARTARQAVEATGSVVRVLCRYLGVVSLACRVRVGPGAAEDSTAAAATLAQLQRAGLSDTEWFTLARDLVAPFAHRKEAHPVPELVQFFQANGPAALERLLASAPPLKDAPEDAALGHLLQLVPQLGAVLERASFLFDYALVVQRTQAERWMGLRHPTRHTQPLAATAAEFDVLLVDAVGVPVATLSPFLQCTAPSGGVPEELFFLEGPGRHGAKLVALPSPFERQDEQLWGWMVERGLLRDGTGQVATTEHAPYKGLSTFSPEDADNYFGREKEAEAFANRLRRESFLAVVGPSGTGKSSFILAGVLPLLPAGWKPLVFRPGAAPLSALQSRLASIDHADVVVLVVDQFEELVTLCQDAKERAAFSQALLAATQRADGKLKVVVTLRDDFLIKIQQLPVFRERLSNALQLLGTPAPEDLRRVVTEPARRVGYTFDDAQLPQRMVDAVAEYPGALALLSFTASQLWDLRDRHLRLMRVKTYDALGGVGGALANHAEATLSALAEDEQRVVREAFRHLVTAQGTRAVLSKKEALEVLGGGARAQGVLEKLVTARLLVSSETASGDDSIEIIHEALISSWPRLVSWQREDADSARLKDAVRASARQWDERGRPSGLLWRKETLAEYRLWRARFPGRLTQLEEAFAAASLRDEVIGQRVRRALISVAFLVLSVGLLVLYRSQQAAVRSSLEAQESARVAHQRMTDLRVEQARLALLDDKPFHAIVYAQAARALKATGTLIDTVEQVVAAKLSGQRSSTRVAGARVLVPSPNGTRMAAVDEKTGVAVLSLPDLKVVDQVPQQGPLRGTFVFLDETHGLVCNRDGAVLGWTQGAPLTPLVAIQARLLQCVYSAQHQLLLGILRQGTVVGWRVSQAPLGLVELGRTELGAPVSRLQLSPSHDLLVAYGTPFLGEDPSQLIVLSLPSLAVKVRLTTGHETDTSVDFLEARGLLAASSVDSQVRLFELRQGTLLRSLKGHAAAVNQVRFSPAGTALLTGSDDRSARLWTLEGEVLATLPHDASVDDVRFTNDTQFLSSEVNGTLNLWQRGVSTPTRRFRGHLARLSYLASPAQFVTTSDDGIIRLWDAAQGVTQIATYPHDLTFLVPSPDRTWAFIGADSGKVSRISLPSLALLESASLTGCDTSGSMHASFGEEPKVASAEGNTLCVLSWKSKTVLKVDAGDVVNRVRLSDDGQLLAVALPKAVVLFDPQGRELQRLITASVPTSLAFISSRQVAVGTMEGSVERFDVLTGSPLGTSRPHTAAILSVAVFGETLWSTSEDLSIVASTLAGELQRRFVGHTQMVFAAVPSPDGTRLASIDDSGAILVWDVASGLPVANANAGGLANDVAWLDDEELVTELGASKSVVRIEVLGKGNPRCLNPLQLSPDGKLGRRVDWEDCFEVRR